MKKSNLILGIGNISRKDDGVGVHVVNYIMNSEMYIPDDVEIIEAGAAVYDILPLMIGRKKVIIIDALRVDDIPGSVYRISSEDLREEYWKLLRGTPELREIIFQLYVVCGDVEIGFIGIVPEDVSDCSLELTDKVRNSLCRAAEVTICAAL